MQKKCVRCDTTRNLIAFKLKNEKFAYICDNCMLKFAKHPLGLSILGEKASNLKQILRKKFKKNRKKAKNET